MRCYICDTELSDAEVQLDEDGKTEPCTTCMKVIMDTAYCDGFEPYRSEEVEDTGEIALLEDEEIT